MKLSDLMLMSLSSLKRRKLRTLLTMLGVVIGTASVVVMISLGIGLDRSSTSLYESYGSMTAIDVYSTIEGDMQQMTIDDYLTDKTVKKFENLEHVKSVTPMLDVYVILKQGVWEANTTLTGVDRNFLEEVELREGKLPEEGTHTLDLIVGNQIPASFYNVKTNKGYWETGELPDVDFMNSPMFAIFDTDAYYSSQTGGEDAPSPPKKYMIKTAGMVSGTVDDWNQHSYSIYVDIDALESQLKRVFKNKPVPGQPTTKKGKPYKEFCYNRIKVYCEDMNVVTDVQKVISDMGYECSSNMEWLEQSRQQSRIIQLVLGGIGAVSLLVAAIGIANTMMMSIYERTREIGIMKVLGCDMGNIRNMFLIESGSIGLLGGIAGVIFSFFISFVVNKIVSGAAADFAVSEDGLSQIPVMLAVGAIAFATAVGTLAGLFPALRAMKMSPLNAIRNE